jgi:hypothetical protein
MTTFSDKCYPLQVGRKYKVSDEFFSTPDLVTIEKIKKNMVTVRVDFSNHAVVTVVRKTVQADCFTWTEA